MLLAKNIYIWEYAVTEWVEEYELVALAKKTGGNLLFAWYLLDNILPHP
jgi:hypothetical protein